MAKKQTDEPETKTEATTLTNVINGEVTSININSICFDRSMFGTVKNVLYCLACGARRSLISFPNDPITLVCQTCKSEFSVIIKK
jgi:hypothetical protein